MSIAPAANRWQRPVLGAVGLALFLFAWQWIGSHKLLGSTWPALDTVREQAARELAMPQPLDYLGETPSQTAGPYVHIGLIPKQAGFDIFEKDLVTY